MKIAFVYDLVYPYSKGGVEKRIRDVARLLSSRGHEVHILGTKCWDGEPERQIDGIWYRGICEPVAIHSREGRRSAWQATRFAFSVGRALARLRFDVVEVQGMTPLACLVAIAVCRFTGNTPIVTWYEVWRRYWHEYTGSLGSVGRLVEWLVARLAPAHTAVSRLSFSRLTEWGVRNVSLTPIGIDYYGIQSVPPAALKTDILYVGRLAPHKNLELLIGALGQLKAEGMEPSVLIIGEGPERRALERRAASEGLGNMRYLGMVDSDDEVMALMKSARVFAFPSVREGFGLAPLEASACGLPVVAVSHPDSAAGELIVDRVTGLLTSSDVGDFAKGLKEVLLDPELGHRMGLAARRQAEAFDWPLMVDAVERAYRKAATSLAQNGAGSRRRQNGRR